MALKGIPMSKLPSDYIQFPNINVSGTPEASNNKFVQDKIPNSDVYYGVIATNMAAGKKVDLGPHDGDESVTQGDSVLSNKDTVIGGTPMGKK